MRRDFYIENDSGGLSVLAAAAADAIIEDGRSDDMRFVREHQVLLQELYGDDSLPVRAVVDEPLTADEQAQWLACSSARIDTPDGRLLVMGGFDPDVLSWWKDEGDPDADGRGVGVIMAAPGSWRVDLYAHVGSMNGRQVLSEADEDLGSAFRRSHPDRKFPLWLLPVGDDPSDLPVDTDTASYVGFLVHVTRFSGEALELPEGGWFSLDTGSRVPDVFPVGLPSDAPDPNLESLRDRLLGKKRPAAAVPPADRHVEVIEAWTGDPLKKLADGEVALPLADAALLYIVFGHLSDSPPRFELWVEPKGAYTPIAATPELAVLQKGATWAYGPPPNGAGWMLWASAEQAAGAVAGLADGATIDFAMTPRLGDDNDDEAKAAIGRGLFSGRVRGGEWRIAEVSPLIPAPTLRDALAFVREVEREQRFVVRGAEERRILEAAAKMNFVAEGGVVWDGDVARLADPDERTLRMIATPLFRTRFAGVWAADPVDIGEDEDGDDD
jgi:hypothetical protein